jgi:hypothetical protein
MEGDGIREHNTRVQLRKKKANGLLTKVQYPVPKIELWNGKRKNSRWEKEFGSRLCGQCALRHEVIDTMYS